MLVLKLPEFLQHQRYLESLSFIQVMAILLCFCRGLCGRTQQDLPTIHWFLSSGLTCFVSLSSFRGPIMLSSCGQETL